MRIGGNSIPDGEPETRLRCRIGHTAERSVTVIGAALIYDDRFSFRDRACGDSRADHPAAPASIRGARRHASSATRRFGSYRIAPSARQRRSWRSRRPELCPKQRMLQKLKLRSKFSWMVGSRRFPFEGHTVTNLWMAMSLALAGIDNIRPPSCIGMASRSGLTMCPAPYSMMVSRRTRTSEG